MKQENCKIYVSVTGARPRVEYQAVLVDTSKKRHAGAQCATVKEAKDSLKEVLLRKAMEALQKEATVAPVEGTLSHTAGFLATHALVPSSEFGRTASEATERLRTRATQLLLDTLEVDVESDVFYVKCKHHTLGGYIHDSIRLRRSGSVIYAASAYIHGGNEFIVYNDLRDRPINLHEAIRTVKSLWEHVQRTEGCNDHKMFSIRLTDKGTYRMTCKYTDPAYEYQSPVDALLGKTGNIYVKIPANFGRVRNMTSYMEYVRRRKYDFDFKYDFVLGMWLCIARSKNGHTIRSLGFCVMDAIQYALDWIVYKDKTGSLWGKGAEASCCLDGRCGADKRHKMLPQAEITIACPDLYAQVCLRVQSIVPGEEESAIEISSVLLEDALRQVIHDPTRRDDWQFTGVNGRRLLPYLTSSGRATTLVWDPNTLAWESRRDGLTSYRADTVDELLFALWAEEIHNSVVVDVCTETVKREEHTCELTVSMGGIWRLTVLSGDRQMLVASSSSRKIVLSRIYRRGDKSNYVVEPEAEEDELPLLRISWRFDPVVSLWVARVSTMYGHSFLHISGVDSADLLLKELFWLISSNYTSQSEAEQAARPHTAIAMLRRSDQSSFEVCCCRGTRANAAWVWTEHTSCAENLLNVRCAAANSSHFPVPFKKPFVLSEALKERRDISSLSLGFSADTGMWYGEVHGLRWKGFHNETIQGLAETMASFLIENKPTENDEP